MPLPKLRIEPGDFAVITLTEPWATLMVLGEKEFETRGWPTSYRGPILIQAAKTMPTYAQDSCLREPFESVLLSHGIALPSARPEDLGGARGSKRFTFNFGCIIGAGYLADTIRTEVLAEKLKKLGTVRAQRELAFGDYNIGRWAFRFATPMQFETPIPVRGALGIWRLEKTSEAADQVRAQMAVALP